jgi:Fe-S-cluster containining protein
MAREVITSKTCRTCGACCIAPRDQPVFCDVEEKDLDRLGRRIVRLHVIQPTLLEHLAGEGRAALATKWRKAQAGPLAGWEFNQCVMLRGSPMHQVGCRIYERRPGVCRNAVKPGDRACREIRRAFENEIEDLRAK